MDDAELEATLRRECPEPATGWRAEFRRALLAWPIPAARPARLRILVAGCAGLGTLLLGLAALRI
jgi:hypothetical protein